MAHIAIIGAGITGVTTAYALMERGYDVTVFDQHRYAGMETSFANGGQLSASNAEVWNKWSTVLQGLRWMMRRDAPLLVNPMPSWHKYSWMVEFVGNIGNYKKNTVETVRLAIEARKHLFAMAEREEIDFDLEKRGILHFYRDKAAFDKAAKVNGLLTEGGLDRRPVTVEEIRQIEPTLKGSYYGGFFTASDATGDIHKFTRGLLALFAPHEHPLFCVGRHRQICRASCIKIIPWGRIAKKVDAEPSGQRRKPDGEFHAIHTNKSKTNHSNLPYRRGLRVYQRYLLCR